jgi:hypothetical protein
MGMTFNFAVCRMDRLEQSAEEHRTAGRAMGKSCKTTGKEGLVGF